MAQISSYQCCAACQVIAFCTSEICSRQTVPNLKNFVIKRKTLSLTVGSALHASLILSNYTVQTITINKSILRKLNDSFGAMVSLLQVHWNEENSREENFCCCTLAPHKCKKDSQGKLPHSRQQFEWYRPTQEHHLLFLPTHGKYPYNQHLSL